MSEVTESAHNNDSTVNANNPAHYVLIAIAVVIGMAGVLLRFMVDGILMDTISNILLVVGSVISLVAVFRILK